MCDIMDAILQIDEEFYSLNLVWVESIDLTELLMQVKLLRYCFAGSESHSVVVLYHAFCVYDLPKHKCQAVIATN